MLPKSHSSNFNHKGYTVSSVVSTNLAPFSNRLENPRERIYLPELLEEVANTHFRKDKIDLVIKFRNKNRECEKLIIDFVQSVYHPEVVYDLPESDPPFNTDYPDFNMAPNTLGRALNFAKYFVIGQPEYIEDDARRENLFIQQLESLHLKDAELLLMVKNKKITGYRGVNERLFREAIPGILPGGDNV